MERFDVVVVGAGVFGAWTASHFARRDKRVSARGCVRAGEFAREFGGRVAHHSDGIRRGRDLHADVAEFAGTVEEVFWIQAAGIVS